MPRLLLATLALAVATGCSSTNRLSRYDFDRATIVAIAPYAAAPDVYTDSAFRADGTGRRESVAAAVVRLGSVIAKEAGAAEARRKLQEAEEEVDVAGRIAGASLDRVARALGARPVDDEEQADFALEILVDRQGIFAADPFTGSMHYGVNGKIRIVHLDSGETVWERRLREREQFAGGVGGSIGAIASGVVLSDMTVDEMVEALERLSDRMALSILDRLGDDLREAGRKARR